MQTSIHFSKFKDYDIEKRNQGNFSSISVDDIGIENMGKVNSTAASCADMKKG